MNYRDAGIHGISFAQSATSVSTLDPDRLKPVLLLYDASIGELTLLRLKELPYESTRRWIRLMQKARQNNTNESESLELVEVGSLLTGSGIGSGIRLLINGIEIAVEKGSTALRCPKC